MKFGVCFGMMAFSAVGVAFGQEAEVNPFDEKVLAKEALIAASPDTWEVMCEVFSLPINEAAALRREHQGSRKIYAELLNRVAKDAAVLEEFVVMKSFVSSEAEATSVEEYLFPTEYEPPELPNQVEGVAEGKDVLGVSSPAHPTAYQSRDLGASMMLGFSRKISTDTIALDFEFQRVSLLGRDLWGKEKSEVEVPQFEAQGLKKEVILKNGSRVLVGTMSPSGKAGQDDRRVWFVFAKGAAIPRADESRKPAALESPSWDLTCEVFSMTLSDAAKLKRAGMSDPEDYAGLVKALKTKEVDLEEFLSVRTAGDGKFRLKEVREMTYATEFFPAELPNSVRNLSNRPEVAKSLITPASPASFQAKEVGTKMEGELVITEGRATHLNANLEVVRYLGKNSWGKGPAEAEMPRFTSQRLMARVEVRLDSPMLMGSISPPEAWQPEEGEERVWLAFLTVSQSEE